MGMREERGECENSAVWVKAHLKVLTSRNSLGRKLPLLEALNIVVAAHFMEMIFFIFLCLSLRMSVYSGEVRSVLKS